MTSQKQRITKHWNKWQDNASSLLPTTLNIQHKSYETKPNNSRHRNGTIRNNQTKYVLNEICNNVYFRFVIVYLPATSPLFYFFVHSSYHHDLLYIYFAFTLHLLYIYFTFTLHCNWTSTLGFISTIWFSIT